MSRDYPAGPGPNPPSEPLFLVPWTVPAFAGTFLVIHAVLQISPSSWVNWAYSNLALLPYRFFGGDAVEIAHGVGTLFTYGFLHFDWLHVLVNVVLLMAAAGPVMRNCGVPRTWIMFLLCSAGGGVLHILVYTLISWGEPIAQVVGASGGAAGVIAAALRYRARRLSQGEIVAPAWKPPVLTFTIFWIGINGLLFLWDVIGGGAVSGFATIVHIGGYLAGLFLAPVLVKGARPRTWPRRVV